MTSDHHISVREWRRADEEAPHPLVLMKHDRCPHMRAVAIAQWVIRWGPDDWQEMPC